jgi:pilus assembly protein Flp/PilA
LPVNQAAQAFSSLIGGELIQTGAFLRSFVNQGLAMRRLTQILRCNAGGTAIEYALIATLISIAAIVGMQNLGGKLNTMFSNVSNQL